MVIDAKPAMMTTGISCKFVILLCDKLFALWAKTLFAIGWFIG